MTNPAATEPLATVQRLYQAFGERDQNTVLSLIDENVDWSLEVTAPGAELVPMFRNHRGHEGVLAYFAGVAQLEMLAFELKAYFTNGRTVLAHLRIHIRH